MSESGTMRESSGLRLRRLETRVKTYAGGRTCHWAGRIEVPGSINAEIPRWAYLKCGCRAGWVHSGYAWVRERSKRAVVGSR